LIKFHGKYSLFASSLFTIGLIVSYDWFSFLVVNTV